MNDNLNDNVRTDGTRVVTQDVTTTRMTAPKTSRLALLLSFAAGAAAAWIIMTITHQNNEVIDAEEQQASSVAQTRRPAAKPQTGKNKTNVPKPRTQ